MLSDDHSRPAEHDDAKVESDGPEGNDYTDAVHAFCSQNGILESALTIGARCGGGGMGSCNSVFTRHVGDFDAGDIVFGACEAAGFINCASSRALLLSALSSIVLHQHQEPSHGKGTGIGCIDDAVEYVEPC